MLLISEIVTEVQLKTKQAVPANRRDKQPNLLLEANITCGRPMGLLLELIRGNLSHS